MSNEENNDIIPSPMECMYNIQTFERNTTTPDVFNVNTIKNFYYNAGDTPADSNKQGTQTTDILPEGSLGSMLLLYNGREPDRTCYNIFVTSTIDMASLPAKPVAESFIIPKDAAIRKFSSKHIIAEFATLQGNAIPLLCTCPSIFVNPNDSGGYAGYKQKAILGYVANIEPTPEGISITPDYRTWISQQELNTHMSDLKLVGHESRNELNIIHWDIKEADLISLLSDFKIIL